MGEVEGLISFAVGGACGDEGCAFVVAEGVGNTSDRGGDLGRAELMRYAYACVSCKCGK